MIRNRKAQLEIFALAILVAGIVTLSSASLLSTEGGVEARAKLITDFLRKESILEGMEIFYSDLVNIAATDVLEEQGYNMNSFCAGSVAINDTLNNLVIDRAEELVTQYARYRGQELPHMKTSDGKGVLEIQFVSGANSGGNYLEISGVPAEKMEVKSGGVKVSSSGYFATQIKSAGCIVA